MKFESVIPPQMSDQKEGENILASADSGGKFLRII
jgi:hypothetical protein